MSIAKTLINTLMEKAMRSPETIAKIVKRPPEQVESALQQAKTLIPRALANDNARGAASMLNELGVNKNIISKKANEFLPYASKIPIFGNKIAPYFNQVLDNMKDKPRESPQEKYKSNTKFDKNKYHKV